MNTDRLIALALGLGLMVGAANFVAADEAATMAFTGAADSTRQTASDSTQTAPTAPTAADSGTEATRPGDTSGKRGMQDSVTTIRGITVESAHPPIEERRTASSTRLDRAAIVRFAPSTAADAMVTAPGVELIKTGPWASRVAFRGFQGERLLVMVDGVRLNTGRGHGSNTSLVSVDQLDEIDLTAGAAGAQHGSDAIGGVINLVTHRPLFAHQPSLSGRLSARGSEPGDQYAQSGRLKFVSPRFGAELNLGQGHQNELVTPREHVLNSGSHDADFGARTAFKLGAASLDFEHTHHAAHEVGLPALDGSYPLISRDAERGEFGLPFVASAFGRDLSTRVQLLGADQFYRTNFDETTREIALSPLTHRPRALITTLAQDRITTRSRELLPELRFGDSDQLRLGGELRRESTSGPKTTTATTTFFADNSSVVTTGVSDNVPNAHRDVRAGSAASSFSLGTLRVEAGARYDWIRSQAVRTATSWTGALDVVDQRWSLDGGLAYHVGAFEPFARIGSGFRAPNLEERYYRGPVHGAMDVWGDTSLVAERNINYEAGLRADADGWGTMRISAYRTQSDDFITLKYLHLVNGRPRFQYANLGRTQVDGLEFNGRARLRSTSTQITVTLPRGRDLATGDQLTDVGAPRVTTEFTTPVGHWLPGGLLALRATWSNGLKSNARTMEQDTLLSRRAYWAVNAELGATVMGARATVAVYNVTNHTFREPLSFIEEPGRTYTFSLKRDFQLPYLASRKERSR